MHGLLSEPDSETFLGILLLLHHEKRKLMFCLFKKNQRHRSAVW